MKEPYRINMFTHNDKTFVFCVNTRGTITGGGAYIQKDGEIDSVKSSALLEIMKMKKEHAITIESASPQIQKKFPLDIAALI